MTNYTRKPREFTVENTRVKDDVGNWTTDDILRGPPLKRGEKIKLIEVIDQPQPSESPSVPAPVVNREREIADQLHKLGEARYPKAFTEDELPGEQFDQYAAFCSGVNAALDNVLSKESPHIVPPETVLVDCLASALETLEKYRTLVVEDQKNGAKFRLGEHAEVTIASIQKRLAEACVSVTASDVTLKWTEARQTSYVRLLNDRIQQLEKENATLRENREFWRLKAMEADGKFAELRERLRKYEEGK